MSLALLQDLGINHHRRGRGVVLFIAIVLISAVKIVKEYERGVIFLGRVRGGAKGPGLFLLIPFVDNMEKVGPQANLFRPYLGQPDGTGDGYARSRSPEEGRREERTYEEAVGEAANNEDTS